MSFKHVVFTFLFLPLFMFHIHSNAQEIKKDEANRLQSFLKKRFGARMPADATIEVEGYEKSSLEGFKKGTFVVNSSSGSGEVTFVISQDGKYLIMGEPVSLEQFEDSPIDGLKEGTLPVGRQSIPVLLSTDGKHIILAEIIDSTVDPLKETMSKISLDDVPVKGNDKAQVTIVEYSDFQCPFCKRATDMLPGIMEEYDGKVKVFYKQLPLPNHNWAKDAAIASICASKQGNEKFWEFHDLVFENQRSVTVDNSKDEFKGFAKKIGLNTDEFDKCLNSPDVAQRLQKEIKEAQSIGVSSTPTFVVDGMIVPGANLQGIKSAIE
ncbi:MAG: DsbA family protein, partial [Thermodesulfobacteriota bacterium]